MTPDNQQMTLQRRKWMYASVGAVASFVGAGIAWWRHTPRPAATQDWQALWGMTFESPHGKKLSMKTFQGKNLVLNFWATWCPPCVEEMPLLDAFYRQNKASGWEVVGIAADKQAAIESFIVQKGIGFPIAMASTTAIELSRRMGNSSGALPYTVVLNAQGEIVHQKTGKISEQDLTHWKSKPSPSN